MAGYPVHPQNIPLLDRVEEEGTAGKTAVEYLA